MVRSSVAPSFAGIAIRWILFSAVAWGVGWLLFEMSYWITTVAVNYTTSMAVVSMAMVVRQLGFWFGLALGLAPLPLLSSWKQRAGWLAASLLPWTLVWTPLTFFGALGSSQVLNDVSRLEYIAVVWACAGAAATLLSGLGQAFLLRRAGWISLSWPFTSSIATAVGWFLARGGFEWSQQSLIGIWGSSFWFSGPQALMFGLAGGLIYGIATAPMFTLLLSVSRGQRSISYPAPANLATELELNAIPA